MSTFAFQVASPRGQGTVALVNSQVADDLVSVREQVQAALATYLTQARAHLTTIGSQLTPVCDGLEEFILDGGKRFRPLFAYAGHKAAGKDVGAAEIKAFASLEFLQACALIHDDLMDASDTRRGKPAMHRRFENLHQEQALAGLSEQFGAAAAILLGDLALVQSDHMLHTSGISSDQLLDALAVHDEMRIELMAGQYLDVREAGETSHNVERSLRIARFKSGKYSIERPLHLGATIALRDPAIRTPLTWRLSEYGLPLGEAFQLRDDLLGIFGDPAVTGKPAGDDLREGKRTVLMAMAMDRTTDAGRKELSTHLGNPDLSLDVIEKLREIINESGAVDSVEGLIEKLTFDALTASQSPEIAQNSQELLAALAASATARKS
jgi:geranylgeranyl diphosphate synthase type I